MSLIIHPVRAIKAAAYGNPTRVRKALYALGYDTRRIRHFSIDRLVGYMSKPALHELLLEINVQR
jgi:hypothetical protein